MSIVAQYFKTLHTVLSDMASQDSAGQKLAADEAVARAQSMARKTHASGNKLMFIGNGGSAGISSHVAIDYSKNGGLRSIAFNDGAALTCLGNDLGYENVFAKQLEFHARAGDLLVAISSSGNSSNIIKGVEQARRQGCAVITLSGFKPDNRLRPLGDVNFYLPSAEYGFVEIGHLAIIHCILDTMPPAA